MRIVQIVLNLGFGCQGNRGEDETASEACQRPCCDGRITEETAGSSRRESSEVADGIHQASDQGA